MIDAGLDWVSTSPDASCTGMAGASGRKARSGRAQPSSSRFLFRRMAGALERHQTTLRALCASVHCNLERGGSRNARSAEGSSRAVYSPASMTPQPREDAGERGQPVGCGNALVLAVDDQPDTLDYLRVLLES